MLSSEEFWVEMCKPEFVRLGPTHGKVGDEEVFTNVPPESVEGFMLSKIKNTSSLLGIARGVLDNFDREFEAIGKAKHYGKLI